MSFLITAGRAALWLWPFISEIFFGGKSFKQIIKDHKVVFVLMLIIVVQLFWNYMSTMAIHRLISNEKAPSVVKEAKAEEQKPKPQGIEEELKKAQEELNKIYR